MKPRAHTPRAHLERAATLGCAAALVCALLCASQTLNAQAAQTPQAPTLTLANPAVNEAQRLIREAHFAEAEGVLRAELQAHPGNAEAMYTLAHCLLRGDKPAEALKQYTAAAVLRRPTADELVSVGQAYVLLDDEADADKWTRQAVSTDPTNAEAWYSLGRIRYTDQKFADAAACFRHVIQLSPQNVKAENNLGLAFEGMNRTDDAVTAYRQAITWQEAAAPTAQSEQPLLNLAIILLHRGDLPGAEPLLTRAVGIAPNDPRIHEQLGHLFLQQSRFDVAAREFADATARDPKNSSLHFLLGQAFRHMGRTREAEDEFALAAQLAQHGAPPSR